MVIKNDYYVYDYYDEEGETYDCWDLTDSDLPLVFLVSFYIALTLVFICMFEDRENHFIFDFGVAFTFFIALACFVLFLYLEFVTWVEICF